MRGILLGITFFSLLPSIFGRGKLFGFFEKGPFFGILMWYWISLMNPQFLLWGSAFSRIPYALIVAVSTFLSWMMSREPKAPPRGQVTVLLVSWMLWMSVTSLFGRGPSADILWLWSLSSKMLLMTLVAYTLTSTRERIEQLTIVSALSIGILGFKGGLWVLLHGGGGTVWGPGGMIGGNNEFGLALITMLPLLIYLQQRYSNTRFKWPLRAMIGLNAIATLFTYSRAALLALSAMLGIAWWRSRHKAFSAIAVVALAVGVLAFAPAKWTARMHSIQNYHQDSSAQVRLYMWRLGWAMALRHPILGGGFHWTRNVVAVNREFAGTFHWPFIDEKLITGSDLPPLISTRAVHSIWFECISSHGFPGFALFLALGLRLLLDARWLMRQIRGRADLVWANSLARMLQASLVGFAVGGSFASMDLYDGFYLLIIIGAATRRVVAAELNKATAPSPVGRVPRVGGVGQPAPAAIPTRGQADLVGHASMRR
jgi:putative inorganic carbon (hco3(-)) transporter